MTLRQTASFAWRTLRSMRTALILLLLLALASAVGSLIPQIPNSPRAVAEYIAEHGWVGRFYLRAGLFDVFGSWWFNLVLGLLVVSLVACLLPRSRGHLRAMRQRPVQARELDAFPLYREADVAAAPADAAAAARGVLRRRGYRVAADGSSVAAEKGALREAGSLVFHWAFLAAAPGRRSSARAPATAGGRRSWSRRPGPTPRSTTTRSACGAVVTSTASTPGSGIRLVDYDDDFDANGLPTRFASEVELLDPTGAVTGTAVVSVNDPVRHGDLRIHQYGFGWAPVVTVTDGGETVFDGPIVMSQESAPEGRSQLAADLARLREAAGRGAGRSGPRDRARALARRPRLLRGRDADVRRAGAADAVPRVGGPPDRPLARRAGHTSDARRAARG